MGKRKTHERFIEEMKMINPTIKIIGKYITAKTRISCECSVCGHSWNPTPDSLIHGYGCPSCGNKKKADSQRKSYEQFLNELKLVFPDVEILSEYISARKPIKYKCKKHNYIGNSTPDNLLRKMGCPYCSGKILYKDDFYSRIDKIHGNTITLIADFSGVLSKRMKCKCNKCGNIWSVRVDHLLEGSGCPACNNSKGERSIANYLSENNIEFISQKRFDDLHGVGNGYLSYDFYLPKQNILIEYQGGQHERPVKFSQSVTDEESENKFNIQVEHDKRKRKYALTNGFKFFEIWYYDDIEQTLNDMLLSKAS